MRAVLREAIGKEAGDTVHVQIDERIAKHPPPRRRTAQLPLLGTPV